MSDIVEHTTGVHPIHVDLTCDEMWYLYQVLNCPSSYTYNAIREWSGDTCSLMEALNMKDGCNTSLWRKFALAFEPILDTDNGEPPVPVIDDRIEEPKEKKQPLSSPPEFGAF